MSELDETVGSRTRSEIESIIRSAFPGAGEISWRDNDADLVVTLRFPDGAHAFSVRCRPDDVALYDGVAFATYGYPETKPSSDGSWVPWTVAEFPEMMHALREYALYRAGYLVRSGQRLASGLGLHAGAGNA